jgi:hypothetical protein
MIFEGEHFLNLVCIFCKHLYILIFLVFIATDRYTRRPRGYCFVTFRDIDDAKDAIHSANNTVSNTSIPELYWIALSHFKLHSAVFKLHSAVFKLKTLLKHNQWRTLREILGGGEIFNMYSFGVGLTSMRIFQI